MMDLITIKKVKSQAILLYWVDNEKLYDKKIQKIVGIDQKT